MALRPQNSIAQSNKKSKTLKGTSCDVRTQPLDSRQICQNVELFLELIAKGKEFVQRPCSGEQELRCLELNTLMFDHKQPSACC